MNIEKVMEEFDENWHTTGRRYTPYNKNRRKELDNIKDFIKQKLEQQREEIVKEIENNKLNRSKKDINDAYNVQCIDGGIPLTKEQYEVALKNFDEGYNKCAENIINKLK